MHFLLIKFAYVRKNVYLCTEFSEKGKINAQKLQKFCAKLQFFSDIRK